MRHLHNAMLALLALFTFTLAVGTASAQQEVHGNVVVVLDASGSMGDTLTDNVRKMEGAKDALKGVLNQLPPDTHVGVVVFGRPEGWVYPLGPRDAARLNAAIDKVQPDGGTPLGEYIKIGADRLLEAMKAQHGYGTFQLLVVTDGNASDSRVMEAYTPDVISRGITFDVIGVAMPGSHALKKWARIYRDAANPEAIKQAAAAILAEVETTDQVGGNPFEIVNAAFSDKTAPATLQALAASGYHPIGETPKAAVSNDGSGVGSAANGGGSTTQGGGCSVSNVGDGAGTSLAMTSALFLAALFARRTGRRRLRGKEAGG